MGLTISTAITQRRITGFTKPSAGRLLFFLLWPFGAFLSGLRHWRQSWSKTIFWLFCIFIGSVFVVAKNDVNSADNSRYAEQLKIMHKQELSFDNLFVQLYNPNEGFLDFYQPMLTWLVAIFTENANFLFAIFAAIFGYFYTQNLWIIFNRINVKVSFVLFLFMLSYALINPIWNINGVRMWTAAQIFVYGILRYFLEKKKSGIIWSVVSILVHFSFIFPLAIVLVFIFLPKRIMPFFIFFLATTLINEINLITIRESLSFLPNVFQPKVEAYTNEAYALNIVDAAKHKAWHITFAQVAGKWIVYTWTILIFIQRKRWIIKLPYLSNLFAFALFIGGWAQLASLVPSGGRFVTVAHMLFFAVFILVTAALHRLKPIRITGLFTAPFLLFTTIFALRVGTDYLGFLTFIGNPFIAFIVNEQTPLIEFVKSLI